MLFGEFPLALLSLTAVSIAGAGGGGGRFAVGVGKLVYAGTFGLIPETFGTALGFATFVIIVLTVTQLVFRVMRVTLAEWVGDAIPPMRNMHVASFISMGFTAALVLTGTWVYLWQMFGASNQLMAALSLLVVSVWLKSEKRNPTYAVVPMVFMYFTTLAATAVTARNLYVTIAANPKMSALPVGGRVGHDRGLRAPVRRGHHHRLGRLQGLPASRRGDAAAPRPRIRGPCRPRRMPRIVSA